MQEVVSSEVIKLNQTLCNKQKQGDQIQFSPEKKTVEKGKWIHHLSTHRTGRWIVLWNNLLINSTRIFFHLPQNIFYASEKKQMSELDNIQTEKELTAIVASATPILATVYVS